MINGRDGVEKPKGKDVIPCKWVLDVRRDDEGIARLYKARFVVCGNGDNEKLTNAFPPVLDFSIVTLQGFFAVQKNWKVHHVNYSSGFLHGTLNGEVYMTLPKLIHKWCIGKVFEVKWTLYRLDESPWV